MSIPDRINQMSAVLVDSFQMSVNPQVARIIFGDSGGTGEPSDAVPRIAIAMPTECLRLLHQAIGRMLGEMDASSRTDPKAGATEGMRH